MGTNSATEPAPDSSAPTVHVPEALEQPGDTGEGSTGEAPARRLFGGLTPQEAGRRSAEARRAKDLARETESVDVHRTEVAIVRTTVATGRIIAKLSTLAEKGDTSAARELRAWLSEVVVEADTDVAALDRATRQALLARLLDEHYATQAEEGVDVLGAQSAEADALETFEADPPEHGRETPAP